MSIALTLIGALIAFLIRIAKLETKVDMLEKEITQTDSKVAILERDVRQELKELKQVLSDMNVSFVKELNQISRGINQLNNK